MIARNADRVPARHLALAKLENIRNQAHGRFGRKDIGAAGSIFLENIILDRATQFVDISALTFCHGDIHCQQHCRRSVDRHAGRDAFQRNLAKERLHIIQRRNRNPHFTNFTQCHWVVGVVANLCRQVKGHRKPGLALFQQVAVACIRFFGAGISRILAHGPEAAAIHAGLHPAGVGIFARESQVLHIIRVSLRRQRQPRQRNPRQGLERSAPFGKTIQYRFQRLLFPAIFLIL